MLYRLDSGYTWTADLKTVIGFQICLPFLGRAINSEHTKTIRLPLDSEPNVCVTHLQVFPWIHYGDSRSVYMYFHPLNMP